MLRSFGMVDTQWLILALNLAERGIKYCSVGTTILSALSQVSWLEVSTITDDTTYGLNDDKRLENLLPLNTKLFCFECTCCCLDQVESFLDLFLRKVYWELSVGMSIRGGCGRVALLFRDGAECFSWGDVARTPRSLGSKRPARATA